MPEPHQLSPGCQPGEVVLFYRLCICVAALNTEYSHLDRLWKKEYHWNSIEGWVDRLTARLRLTLPA
jgi:hypothetical protein